VALKVFETAQQRDQPVTMQLVKSVMAELAGHHAGCCQACEAVRQARAEKVFFVASAWFSSIAATTLAGAALKPVPRHYFYCQLTLQPAAAAWRSNRRRGCMYRLTASF
jgi:uncharacterized protein (DUF169 family)